MKKFIFFLIILFPCLCQADWPMYRGNHYLTGNNDEIVPNDNSLNWFFEAPSELFYPIPHKEIVFVACLNRDIYALNKISGEVIWKLTLDAPAFKSPATYKNFLLVAAGDFLYVIDIQKGSILWSRKEGISIQLSTPIVLDDIVYYGSRKFFYARYVQNGHEIWKNDQVSIYGGTPVYWNQNIYFVSKNFTTRRSILMCLNAKTGQLKWQQDFPSDPNIFTPVVYGKKVYISSFDKIYCFDALQGEMIWEKNYKANISSPIVYANNSLYCSLSDGKIYRFNPEDGSFMDYFENFNPQGANFILIGETLLIPNENGLLHAYNGSTKTLKWKFQAEYKNRKGYLAAEDGRAYYALGPKLYSICQGTLMPPASMIAMPIQVKDAPPAENQPEMKPNEEPAPQPGPEPVSQPEPKKIEKENIDVSMKDNNNNPLSGKITVEQDNQLSEYMVKEGKTTIEVEKDKDFTVIAQAKDYFVKSIDIDAKQKKKSIDITLDPLQTDRSYVFNNIEFQYNSAELTYNSFPTLEAIAELFKQNPNVKLEIGGFTDNTGSDEYNKKLSQRRADKVKEYLIKKGVLDERINSKGYGEDKPVADNNTEEGRALNRRTEFKILK